jgi:hypothetical protein
MKKIIFETKEQYLNTRQAWKQSCKDKSIKFQPEHFALYAIMQGKDPKACFAKPEQQSKSKLIGQGKTGWESYNRSMSRIMGGYNDESLLAPFSGKLTKEHLQIIRESYEFKKEAA